MVLRTAIAATLCLGLTALASPTHAADVVTGWAPMQLSQDDCLRTGAEGIASVGFRGTTSQQSAFGWRGEENISIRCISDHQIAVFYVYLRTSEAEGRSIVERLRAFYAGGGAPRPGGSKF